MRTRRLSATARLGAAIFLAACPVLAQAPRYTVVDLGLLPGAASSVPVGINNLGDVVGTSQASLSHAFLFTDAGGMIDIGRLPGATSANANDVNDLGQITGESGARAFRYTPGRPFENLGTLGGPPSQSAGRAIDNLGQVAGETTGTSRFGFEPFLFADGSGMVALTPGIVGRALDSNSSGQVVGYAGLVPFVHTPGVGVRYITTPTAYPYGYATAINELGEVAGAMTSANGNTTHLFRWTGTGGLQDLGLVPGGGVAGLNRRGEMVGSFDPGGQVAFVHTAAGGREILENLIPAGSGWRLTIAWGINERGQIICTGYHGLGARAVRLDPITPHAAAVPLGRGCGGAVVPTLTASPPVIGTTLSWTVHTASGGTAGSHLIAFGRPRALDLGSGCTLFVDPSTTFGVPFVTGPTGDSAVSIALPPATGLSDLVITIQAAVMGTGVFGVDLSNGVLLRPGD